MFSDLNINEENQLIFEDTYNIDTFRKRIETREFDVVICDELIYEALQRIDPKIREIIVLKFWGEYTDRELGEILDMSRQMITYNKNKAINLLRKIIKELKKNDIRFK